MQTIGTSSEPGRLRAGFVPKARYTSPEFLASELDCLWPHVWQVACREEEIPGTGDFVEYTLHGDSIVVVRASDADIKAYFNTCRHRGTRIVSGTGKVGELRCRYHGWRWHLDGSSKEVVCREQFESCSDADLDLVECRAETWGGWVFVNMDPRAEPLLDFLAPLPDQLAPFKLDQQRYLWYRSAVLPCNWKVGVEAFIEAFHVQATHPQLSQLIPISYRAEQFETHSRFHGGDLSPRAQGTEFERLAELVETHYEDLKALYTERDVRVIADMRRTGIPDGQSAHLLYLEKQREFARADGVDWPDLTFEQMGAIGNWHTFPNMVGMYMEGCSLVYRFRPNGLDPHSCVFDAWSLELFPDGEPRPPVIRELADWTDRDRWGVILSQDFDNLVNVQAGLRSRACVGARINLVQETNISKMHQVIDRYIDRWSGAAQLGARS